MTVRCPNCKTKFDRERADQEKCGVCEQVVRMKPVKEKR